MNPLQMVVADDTQVNAGMRGDFDLHHDEFSLAMTAGGLQAARAAEGSTADWLLTDLRMPVMDGFHFLSYLMDHRFDLPIVLSHAPDSDTCQRYVLTPEAAPSLPLPLGRRPGTAARSDARAALTPSMRHGVSLLEFLRFCADERQTRVLEVSTGGHSAVLHLTFGKLIHAQAGRSEGLPVLLDALLWKEPRLRILPVLPGLRISITLPMDEVLSRAELQLRQREAPSGPPVSHPFPFVQKYPRPPTRRTGTLGSWLQSKVASARRTVSLWRARLSKDWRREESKRRLLNVVDSQRDAGIRNPAR